MKSRPLKSPFTGGLHHFRCGLEALCFLFTLSMNQGLAEDRMLIKQLETPQPIGNQNSDHFQYKFNGKLFARTVDTDTQKARLTGAHIDGDILYKFSNHWQAFLSSRLILETGSSESRFSQEFAPDQSIVLLDAGVSARFWNNQLEFEIGALNQEFWNSPLLLAATAFPGARQGLSLNTGHYTFALKAQQSIAQYQNQTNRLDNVEEGTPLFLRNEASLSYQSNSFEARLHTALNEFENLSSSVAHQSRFFGNTVEGISVNDSELSYGMKVYESGLNFGVQLGKRLFLAMDGKYFFNALAPDGLNEGREITLSPTISFNHHIIGLEVGQFALESDVTSAYYNDQNYGHTNTRGERISLSYSQMKEKYRLTLVFINAKPLRESVYQSDSQNFLFGLSKGI